MQLGILVAMKDTDQNIPNKERDMIPTDFKELSIGTSTYCIKLMGLATYAAHKWQDKAQSTKTVAIPTNVSMKLNYRKTEKLTDHSRRIPSEYVRDTESLIKVELHMSTIIGADHTTYPAVPKNTTNYR